MPLHPCTDACRYEEMEAVIDRLRQGDTCARMCEGTAYRIEAKKLRAALARLAAAVGELPENGSGTVQGAELNAAYSGAMALLTPNVPSDRLAEDKQEERK